MRGIDWRSTGPRNIHDQSNINTYRCVISFNQSLNWSLSEPEEGSKMREAGSWGGLGNNIYNASSVSLDDKPTTSGSAGQIELRDNKARAGSTECEAYTG
jgi:hypothetical protein